MHNLFSREISSVNYHIRADLSEIEGSLMNKIHTTPAMHGKEKAE